MTRTGNDPQSAADAFRRFEHAGWVEVGTRYDDAFGALTAQAIEPLLDAARVGAGTRVLDVACGPGRIAAAAARRGAAASGVDFSGTMVAEARRLHPGIEFREGDAEALEAPDRAFDAVIMGFGLLHLARPERALAEAFRVLVPGGRLAFSVWDAPSRSVPFGVVRGAIEAHGRLDVGLPEGPDFFRFSDPGQCRDALAAAGFGEIQVGTVPLRWRVPSSDAVVDAFLAAGVRTRGLLRAQAPEALAAIRAAVRAGLAPYEAAGGSLDLPTSCVVASAGRL